MRVSADHPRSVASGGRWHETTQLHSLVSSLRSTKGSAAPSQRLSLPASSWTVAYFSTIANFPPALLCSALGAIQLGSKTAFTDLVGSFIILTTVSYALAIGPHLFTGRRNVPPGPFWMGSLGYFVNAVSVLLIVFFNIMFCFRTHPHSSP